MADRRSKAFARFKISDRGERSGLIGRFLRSRCGVTVIEFALVGPLFLLLTFAIVDNGLVLFMQTVLDNATRVAARQIEIGQVTTSSAFQTSLCNNLGGFIPCNSLQWYVQSSNAGFSSLTPAGSNPSGNLATTGFTPGSGKSYVLVQVGYAQPYIIPALAQISASTGNLLLLSTVAQQNENF